MGKAAAVPTGLGAGTLVPARRGAAGRGWRLGALLVPIASIAGGLLLWEIVSRAVVANKLFLAAPSQVVLATIKLAASGQLGHHVAVSGSEFALGYAIASVAGILLGMAMAGSAAAKGALQPWVSGLYATPTVALAPLFLLWFGVGIWSKVVVVVTLVIFPVALNTEFGLLTASPRLKETARSFGASAAQIFFKISLPSATPFIFTGLKLGVGRALIGVVVAELFGSRAGLGRLISDAAETFDMPDLFAGVVILAVSGIGLTALFNQAERRLFAWKQD